MDDIEQKLLLDELSLLTKEQAKALNLATYFRMTPEEARGYDQRAQRISELCRLVKAFRPKP